MPFMNEDKVSIKLIRQEKGWGAKHICKGFLTKSGQSVLSEICARLTQRTRSLGRPVADGQGLTECRACSWTDMQSGRQPWVQQKSQRYWKVDRNILQLSATSRGFGWSQGQTVHLLDQPRPTIHQQSRWSVATVIKSKAVVQVNGGHIKQLFTWLSGCCTLLYTWI